ncbi:MAG: redox-sensing transcriptional repressor Rex [Ruminococcaceae bacterium]|nr:redox-sensing transcriptional repressor Rex [Oscillospiraceae bacterium]
MYAGKLCSNLCKVKESAKIGEFYKRKGRAPLKPTIVPRATLGRLPVYLQYLKSLPAEAGSNVSATTIAKALGLGEVQVRKDLSAVSGAGKPKIGYAVAELIEQLEDCLGSRDRSRAVLVGAGKLGRALFDYRGFDAFGIDIVAAFDRSLERAEHSDSGKTIYPMEEFGAFCKREAIRIGILTVPAAAAQSVCEEMVRCGITAIWSFSPGQLTVPEGVVLRQENLALSLAYLTMQIKTDSLGASDEEKD